MSIVWITDSNLGSFGIEHSFNSDPVTIQFSADVHSSVTLVAGSLPLGLKWETYPDWIRIYGIAAPISGKSQIFSLTFRITDQLGIFVDKTFIIEILSEPMPEWSTYHDLGRYVEGYSFNSSPLSIFYSADSSAKVILLNGELPPGLIWTQHKNQVVITSAPDNVTKTTSYSWTFRLTNPSGTIADQTFTMTIVSLVEYPVWETKPNLGYVTFTDKKEFHIHASISSKANIRYFINNVYPQVSIDSERGILYYDGSKSSGHNYTTLSLTIRAEVSPDIYSDQIFTLTEVPENHAPLWVTSNALYVLNQESYLRFPLETYLPRPGNIQCSISSTSVGFPFKLDPDGLLYGEAPTVKQNQFYNITVNAFVVGNTITSSTDQTFTFEVVKTVDVKAIQWRNAVNEIINVDDGVRAVFDIGAISRRKSTVKHSIIGGQVPPGMILDKIQGYLVGFIDYHCVDKDYYFNIQASDDIDSIIRTVHMRVSARYGYQFSEIRIPLTGDIKQRWLSTSNFIMTNGNISPNVGVTGNTLFQPYMTLIKGLNSTIDKPEKVITSVWPSLEQLTLRVGNAEIVTTNSSEDVLLYRNIIDDENGSEYVVDFPTSPYKFIPPSLENIRQAFTERCKFANGGMGIGAEATALVEVENGEILGINLFKTGSGYTYAPIVTINGTGTGATFKSYIKLNSFKIIEAGSNWQIGEHYIVDIGNYKEPAEIVVTDTTPLGGLKTFYIVNGGLYTSTPIGKIYIKNNYGILTGIDPDFSVARVDVLTSGSGYGVNSTTVSFNGMEMLPNWQTSWQPHIPIALASINFANTVINNSELAITTVLDGAVWQINDLEWVIQGLYHQGSTRFTEDHFSLDGGITAFEEYMEPRQTVFDTTYLTFEKNNTTFDVGSLAVRDARVNWGRTLIDNSTTAFEFYATIFDAPKAPSESLTAIRKLIPLQQTPQPFIPVTPT